MFDQTRHALQFFSNNQIPFWAMSNENQRLGSSSSSSSSNGISTSDIYSRTSNWCLAQRNTANVLVVYLLHGGTDSIDLDHDYHVKWYNPKTGGALINGTRLAKGEDRSLGSPPNGAGGAGGGALDQDWVVLLERATLG